MQIRFGSHVFGAAQPPSFGRVCEALGPTYPGEPTGGQYPLQYPGVLFLFPQPPAPQQQHQQQQQPQQQHGPGAGSGSELPVPLSTPASRIIIHHGSAASLAAAQAAPPPALPLGSTYFEAVEAVAGQGLLLCGGGQLLRFGDSPQDLTSELGQPSSTHTKPASSVPHGSGALLAAGAGTGAAHDFVYCYAQRGLDALFCGTSHRLKKLVLHANPPGHPNFGLYSKCNFRCAPALPGSVPATADGVPRVRRERQQPRSAWMMRLVHDAAAVAMHAFDATDHVMSPNPCVALEVGMPGNKRGRLSIMPLPRCCPPLQGSPCWQLELAGSWRQLRRGRW
jgi:hypothetical protein